MKYTFDESILSDLFKDAYGYRPTAAYWERWHERNDDQKQAEWEFLCKLSDEAVEEEYAYRQECIKRAEESIAKILDTVQGSTRQDAVRYLIDLYKAEDVEDLEWQMRVPFGYFKKTA
jgi:hypothetical protein